MLSQRWLLVVAYAVFEGTLTRTIMVARSFMSGGTSSQYDRDSI